MMFKRSIQPALLLALLLPDVLMAGAKIEFWDQQRKGANCFNVEPTEQWFAAARTLGIEWVRLTYSKWKGQQRDFLMGNADNFTGLVREDLNRLIQVLDWADKHDIKVVLTPLGLPGCRWRQNNNMRPDLRLWQDKAYWQQAAQFWHELAAQLKDHPAICAYNILNEPTPEKGTGLAEDGPAERYLAWYQKYQGTSHDLPAFYETVIQAIRKIDIETPIMLDSGWYAQPAAFVHWPRIKDAKILYSFHMYEPYQFTSYNNFREKRNLRYPGKIPYASQVMDWNQQQIESYFAPFFAWARKQGIPHNRLVNGEFGCYRRNDGCQAYLVDVIAVLNDHKLHWAFYSFREDEWDGMDYEVGTGGLGADYWAANEAGQHPEVPRRDNPLFEVIKREFVPVQDSADSVALGDQGIRTQVWQPSPGHRQIPVWPGAAPDAKPVPEPESVETWETEGAFGNKPVVVVSNVSQPTMTVYPAEGKNTGAAVIVFPGGGYQRLAIDLEGTEVCDWLVAQGITGVLLKYRVPGSGPHFDWTRKRFINPKPLMALQDAQRTLGLLRLNAAELNIDPHKIGVLGFSAGGYLVAAISTHFERVYAPIDAADKESCRPDFAVAIYPGHLSIAYKADLSQLNPGIRVTKHTPPTFLLHAQDDPTNPVEYSLLYYAALKNANVPVEMHLFTQGKHAFGLRRTELPITRWPELVETWLQTIGVTAEDPELRRLIEALSSDAWREREQAVEALGGMDLKARGAIGHLSERLADEQWHVRKAAAIALSQMGPVAERAIPSLITALTDEEWHVRKPAGEALAAIGPASAPAVPALTEALEDEEWQVRSAAAQALAAIGLQAKPAVPRLISALDDEEWKMRKHAAQALAAIGTPSEAVLSALRQAVNDEEEQVRDAATQALNRLADE